MRTGPKSRSFGERGIILVIVLAILLAMFDRMIDLGVLELP